MNVVGGRREIAADSRTGDSFYRAITAELNRFLSRFSTAFSFPWLVLCWAAMVGKRNVLLEEAVNTRRDIVAENSFEFLNLNNLSLPQFKTSIWTFGTVFLLLPPKLHFLHLSFSERRVTLLWRRTVIFTFILPFYSGNICSQGGKNDEK